MGRKNKKKVGFFKKMFSQKAAPKKRKAIAKKIKPLHKKVLRKPIKQKASVKKIKPLIKKKPIKKLIVPMPSKGRHGTQVTMPPLHKKAKNKPAFKKAIILNKKKLKIKHYKKKPLGKIKEFMKTGIEGLDTLLEKGVPKGASVLLAGGAGSGKTIMGLQVINNLCKQGRKCLYMSFEESEERLREHMSDFGWDAKEFERKGVLMIKRFNPFDITRSVDALLEKAKGELLIDVQPVILPDHFKPEFIVLDSLTAIASAFSAREESYRIYIEQLFRFLENIGATSFLITETEQMPTKFSTTGVEEFLADGVIVLYAIKLNDIRENAIEVLKMRGVNHQKKIVAMRVIEKKGVEIYPEQEVYASMIEKKE